ncbi:hypothetical protein [Streptomyces milbemycinicus]|uniref:Uncharacterized protein n=1 Tax=Streptomyces milbemycinicus TaxID=476552 RepID=A0ABW8M1C7_9ACTN
MLRAEGVVAAGHTFHALDEAAGVAAHPLLFEELVHADQIRQFRLVIAAAPVRAVPQHPEEETRVIRQEITGVVVVDDKDAETHPPPGRVQFENAYAVSAGIAMWPSSRFWGLGAFVGLSSADDDSGAYKPSKEVTAL